MDVLVSLKHDGKLSDYVNKAYAAKHLCDVKVVTGDQSTFYTHRLVLSAFSEFFQRKISGEQESHNMVIPIDVDSAVFKVLMEFMYTGQLSVTTAERISLYHASVILEMDTAQELLQQAYISSDWPGMITSKVTKSSGDNDPDVKVTEETDVKVTVSDIQVEKTLDGVTPSNVSDLTATKKKRGRKKKKIENDVVEPGGGQQELGVEALIGEVVESGDNRMMTRNRGRRRPVVSNTAKKSKKTGKKEFTER